MGLVEADAVCLMDPLATAEVVSIALCVAVAVAADFVALEVLVAVPVLCAEGDAVAEAVSV